MVKTAIEHLLHAHLAVRLALLSGAIGQVSARIQPRIVLAQAGVFS